MRIGKPRSLASRWFVFVSQAVPLDALARDVLAGRIPDAKTQAAILRVYCMEHGFAPK